MRKVKSNSPHTRMHLRQQSHSLLPGNCGKREREVDREGERGGIERREGEREQCAK